MPLAIGKEVLDKARREGYAVPGFNTNNLEITQAILEVADELRAPVFIQVSDGARKYAGMENLANLVKDMASRVRVPVVLHLDHGADFKMVMQALRAGFTSVMIDASHHPFEENVAETKKVVEAAHAVGVSVEAELGRLQGIEDNIQVSEAEAFLTDPDEAERFVAETGIDYLAIAIGTSHGAYKGKGRPYIDHKRLEEISKRVSIPLVLHGASGVPTWLKEKLLATGAELKEATGIHDEDIKKAIPNGIAKINIDTDLRLAMTLGIREVVVGNPKEFDPRKIIGKGRDYLKQVIREKFELMSTVGRA
ncbi:fructose-1,6-bisphosphate aldolase, class II [Thermus scotoductus]|uniref:Fructose-1,6-bisphosphate aldolase, class II n=3 Tax=Thermus scotoductus TaxID=37636 RepID=A0ABY0AK03_THESC|nr:class II fructose-1,6-bisphosphate aldolase [Thermus scotoductus]RTH10982.1 fructose-1,6-bisphosphate aldolase, class II [Thermus scotoductus]RTH16807.1 fructose-1,6-bisphosphate aldolase, class II [Thermus scotoductus]RTH33395.1 fructose-1,6-bisphosphate aldolase, class II [Thermus scotoductus]RTI09063.1 fructose-1,6-bisphosphate aldolase, class II [Thermus scotoductus]RTI16016.1 fructose-1,6-bisphosphate aldolase, class II [Thermus scotoductus]